MIEMGFRDPVQWRVATGRHDWLDGAVLSALVDRWTANGLIGRPDRFEAGDEDEPWTLGEDESLVDAILRIPRNGAGGLSCRLRGERPRPWWMSLVLSSFEPEWGRTRGYSMLNLNLPRKDCEAAEATLLDLFEELHRPDSCEYASIHPEHHGEILRLRAYVPALTIGPMFAGLLWANFLGPGIVETFRRETIDRLDVARRRWFNSRGVFLAVSEDLGTIDSPACEKKLIALTEVMRASSN
jgi:hypothetical protein